MSLGPVLVTGANGFCASHIIEKLLEADPGIEIHGIDVLTTRFVFPGVKYHDVDISDQKNVERVVAIAKPATVFHLASPEFSNVPISRFHAIVADGTKYLLDACKNVGTVRAFVHTSTSSAINDNLRGFGTGRARRNCVSMEIDVSWPVHLPAVEDMNIFNDSRLLFSR